MKIESTRDNIYLNVIINPDPRNPSKWHPCVYNDNLNIPILSNPSEYYGSIVRFTVPLDGIPLMLFPLDTKQNSPNVSSLFIGVSTPLGVNYSSSVKYVALNSDTIPTPFYNPNTGDYFNDSQASLPYYYMYSVNSMIRMINTALNDAFTASGISGPVPFYSYNPVTELISLNVDNAFVTSGATIFINNDLCNYLSSFQWFDNSPLGVTNAAHDDFIHSFLDLPNVAGIHIISQDYTSMSLWFDLRKIIITSNSMPIAPEIVPALGSGGVSTNLQIVTDFAITLSSTGQVDQVAVYNPTSQYRLIDMTSTNPITRIQFSFQWEDKFGTIYPIYISPLQQASLKMGFFKKSLYKHEHL